MKHQEGNDVALHESDDHPMDKRNSTSGITGLIRCVSGHHSSGDRQVVEGVLVALKTFRSLVPYCLLAGTWSMAMEKSILRSARTHMIDKITAL